MGEIIQLQNTHTEFKIAVGCFVCTRCRKDRFFFGTPPQRKQAPGVRHATENLYFHFVHTHTHKQTIIINNIIYKLNHQRGGVCGYMRVCTAAEEESSPFAATEKLNYTSSRNNLSPTMALLLCVFMARCIIVKHKGTPSRLGLFVCFCTFFFFYHRYNSILYSAQNENKTQSY